MRERSSSLAVKARLLVVACSVPLLACTPDTAVSDDSEPSSSSSHPARADASSTFTGSSSPTGEPAADGGWLNVDEAQARAINDDWPDCLSDEPTLVGTPRDDRIRATDDDDVILTLGGDDVVIGARGIAEFGDLICTGTGDDTVRFTRRAYAGDSVIRLGSGDDHAHIDSRGIEVFGGSGNDTIHYARNSWGDVAPGPGDDIIRAAAAAGYFRATCLDLHSATRPVHVNLTRGHARGQGHDRLTNVRCAWGSRHDDFLIGTPHIDRLDGGDGVDLIRTKGGLDDASGTYGSLASSGTGARPGFMARTDGPDRIYLGPGDDTAEGDAGGDRIYGGPGADELTGDTGGDYLDGGPGNDYIYGGFGCMEGFFGYAEMLTDIWRRTPSGSYEIVNRPPVGNEVFGGDGDDFVSGDRGNDRLDGGPGADSGTGGYYDGRIDWIESVETPNYCKSRRGPWPPFD